MSIKKLQGEVFQLGITLRDINGNDVNPAANIFNKIEVFVTSRADKKVYAKFSTITQIGYIHLPVVNGKLILNVPATATIDSPVGYFDVQVDMYIRKDDAPGRQVVVKKKGVIYEVKEAVKP